MDTCIALRTMVIKGQTVYLQAGGIVADSVPATGRGDDEQGDGVAAGAGDRGNAVMSQIDMSHEIVTLVVASFELVLRQKPGTSRAPLLPLSRWFSKLSFCEDNQPRGRHASYSYGEEAAAGSPPSDGCGTAPVKKAIKIHIKTVFDAAKSNPRQAGRRDQGGHQEARQGCRQAGDPSEHRRAAEVSARAARQLKKASG